jgi:hypothetical protein
MKPIRTKHPFAESHSPNGNWATVNQQPPAHHEGWMVEGQETLFHWLLVAWLRGWLAQFVSSVTYSKPTGPMYVLNSSLPIFIPTYLHIYNRGRYGET